MGDAPFRGARAQACAPPLPLDCDRNRFSLVLYAFCLDSTDASLRSPRSTMCSQHSGDTLGRRARAPRLGAAIGRDHRLWCSGAALGRGPRATRSLLAPGLRPKNASRRARSHDVGLRLASRYLTTAKCRPLNRGASKCEPHILPRTPFRSSWRHCGQRISALIQALMSPPNYPRRRAMRPFSAADTAKFDCSISDGGERFFMRRSLQKNGGT